MHYCDNCHLVCEGPVCPYCGKAHLRAPENSDYCYLATMVSPWGEAMQELLTDARIPVSYTHLDVYKRQVLAMEPLM